MTEPRVVVAQLRVFDMKVEDGVDRCQVAEALWTADLPPGVYRLVLHPDDAAGGLVCQACAGDAPGGKCKNPRCVGGPIVEEIPDGVAAVEAPSVDNLMELARQYAHAYFNHHTGSRDGMLEKTQEALRAALALGVDSVDGGKTK